MIPYSLQKFFVRLYCRMTRRPVPIDYENWHEMIERMSKWERDPETLRRIREMPPSFTYQRGTGRKTEFPKERGEEK